ncbi:YigZ family protein [Sutterella sp.]|uniref:YigZ family protein n=1 Tax=Sutterella sp. TaxID=1981025 RepID=UPI0026DF5E7E|nr:YigZ family protein [Sutterella sp.]MDO5530871.1 YigZ family protein [Sutterella sp.]
MSETYPVPDLPPGGIHRAEETIKRSRFIVTMARAASPEAAHAFVERIRAEHPQATHNCWAFNAGAPGSTAQVGASDDGEPKGTAGRPMLTALLHSGVGEIVAVVTRYFGGTLLGTGGLVRAYQGSVKLGLEGLPVREREVLVRYVISMDTAYDGSFQNLARELGCEVLTADYRWDASYEILVPEAAAGKLEAELARLTSGEALIDRQEEEAN